MGHFQPHALTITRAPLWEERRRFNEAVLDTPERAHRQGDRFVAVTREEVGAVLELAGDRLEWAAWHRAFQRITRRVVLGDAAADDGTSLSCSRS